MVKCEKNNVLKFGIWKNQKTTKPFKEIKTYGGEVDRHENNDLIKSIITFAFLL